jgi:hypothetical protein
VSSSKADSKAAREQSSQENTVRMQELKNELRKDNKPEAKRIETQPVDIGSDLNKKDTTAALDLRKEAKKKAEAKKEAQ